MDDTAPKLPLPRRVYLTQRDIALSRESRDGTTRVVARVECARRHCTMEVEQCARCPHFARIETHEAGYVILCRDGEAESGEDTENDSESDQGVP